MKPSLGRVTASRATPSVPAAVRSTVAHRERSPRYVQTTSHSTPATQTPAAPPTLSRLRELAVGAAVGSGAALGAALQPQARRHASCATRSSPTTQHRAEGSFATHAQSLEGDALLDHVASSSQDTSHHVGTDVGFGVGNGVGWGVGRGVGAGSGATVGDPSLTDGDRVGDFVGDCEGFVVGAGIGTSVVGLTVVACV